MKKCIICGRATTDNRPCSICRAEAASPVVFIVFGDCGKVLTYDTENERVENLRKEFKVLAAPSSRLRRLIEAQEEDADG